MIESKLEDHHQLRTKIECQKKNWKIFVYLQNIDLDQDITNWDNFFPIQMLHDLSSRIEED